MLPKILLTVAIIVVVWYGFRIANKWLGGSTGGSTKPNVDDEVAKEQIEDLARCPICETYVDASGNYDCSRADCPMTGAAN